MRPKPNNSDRSGGQQIRVSWLIRDWCSCVRRQGNRNYFSDPCYNSHKRRIGAKWELVGCSEQLKREEKLFYCIWEIFKYDLLCEMSDRTQWNTQQSIIGRADNQSKNLVKYETSSGSPDGMWVSGSSHKKRSSFMNGGNAESEKVSFESTNNPLVWQRKFYKSTAIIQIYDWPKNDRIFECWNRRRSTLQETLFCRKSNQHGPKNLDVPSQVFLIMSIF